MLIAEEPQAIRNMIDAMAVPLESYPGARTPWRVLCLTCDSERTPTLGNVRAGHRPCKPCAMRTFGDAQLAADAPRAVRDMLEAGAEPQVPYPGSVGQWRCRCLDCGKLIDPRLGNVRRGQGPCIHCAGNARVEPEKAAAEMLAARFLVDGPYRGTNISWPGRCLDCGSTVPRRLSHIRSGHGCRQCAGLAPTDPVMATQELIERGFVPLASFPGLREPWRCACQNCGGMVRPRLSNLRKRETRGCDKCSNRGLDLVAPARLYVMMHPGYGALKVGVGGLHVKPMRVQQHQQLGWHLYQSMDFATGRDAYIIEQNVLQQLRARGLIAFLTDREMPQGGKSETFDAKLVTAEEIWKMAQAMDRDLDQELIHMSRDHSVF
jgi:hypothetical protein